MPRLTPNANEVAIRMYGQGFGDCFLLAFPRETATAILPADDPRPVYVVVDCGAVLGTPDEPERLQKVVADIRDSTGGHLDLLVITHEHRDHLSGFAKAEAIWREIAVDALWLSWMEVDDPDGLPGWLKALIETQKRSLALAADRARFFGLDDRHDALLGLMSFLVDDLAPGDSFAAAHGTGDAYEIAKGLVKVERHTFCEPGDIRPLPGTTAAVHVLGPPKNEKRLRQLMKKAEVYSHEESAGGDPALAVRRLVEGRSTLNAFAMPLAAPGLLAAADMGDDATNAAALDLLERSFPFDGSLRVPLDEAERLAGAHPAAYPALASYANELNDWRRIDGDWLGAANAIALEVDSLINNTSLVLAIELPAPPAAPGAPDAPGGARKVLLLVGDAQVGNWLSWDDISVWRRHGDVRPSREQPDVVDLLARTAFYKVGHHGSHNATLKAKGVERMGSGARDALTVFVPVSQPVAHEIKGWRHIPLPPLLDALSARSGGRVVMPDGALWRSRPGGNPGVAADIGVTVSDDALPLKRAKNDDGVLVEIEGSVPLWVHVAIPY